MSLIKKTSLQLLIVICVVFLQASSFGADYLSPRAMVYDGADTIYIADTTGKAVHAFSTTAQEITQTFELPVSPHGMVLDASSNRLYIAGGSDYGVVLAMDTTTAQTEVIQVGHTPMSPVLHDSTLYVCNRFDNTVSVIDTTSSSVIDTIAVGREPIGLALNDDGSKLVAAHHLPEGPANDNYNVIQVAIIDTASRTITATIDLVNGSSGGRGVCISPDGYAYVTHLVGRYQMPTNQLERGWIWTNALSVIDVTGGVLVNTVLVDDIYAGAANPWAVACSDDGSLLCVTHAGSQEVSVIDRAGLHARLADVAAGIPVQGGFSDSAEDVPNDFGFLSGLRKRVQLVGNGPRSIILIGNQAYVGQYYSESVDTFDITKDYPAVTGYVLGDQEEPGLERLGEQYFNDGIDCYQKWLSCVSCHPDGRADGLNWDLGNDGLGSPRNAKSLLLAHFSAPAMITGIRADAPTAVNAGYKYIQFMTVPQEKEDAVNAYLSSERPVPSPYLVNGNYSEAAVRGREIFFGTARCGQCHQGDLYIDPSDPANKQLYDVGTNRPDDIDSDTGLVRKLDVGTLAEVWRTAPYLQGGQAATMREVLTTYNPDDRHGRTSSTYLTAQELDDLEEFVLSIGKSLYSSDPIGADIAGAMGESDGKVDLLDYSLLASEWLKGQDVMEYSLADVSGVDGSIDFAVDIYDLREIGEKWLFSY